jgi:cyclomaltodextrinase / maltogenic alpha-amylase / neopullulanase
MLKGKTMNMQETNRMMSQFQTPDWVRQAVFYQIFPDRFAASPKVQKPDNLEAWDGPPSVYGFKGGDLRGVAERLDYLQDLGITAIYFNPIFQAACSHRYHTHDYFQIDPILGGREAFDLMLDEAHQRGIRVVLDGVFNHASRGFFQFNHILENGASSPYLNWFHIHDFPLNAYQGSPNYEAWVNLPALPKLNTGNPQVRQFILSVARYWLEQGIDGWRLDVPFEIDDDDFWQEFRRIVKTANPQAYIVGEVPWEAQRYLQGDQFDAVMNYQFTQACLGFFGAGQIDWEIEAHMMGLPKVKELDGQAFLDRTRQLLEIYPAPAAQVQLNLLSSHDMPRFASLVGKDRQVFRLATLFQMTYPGAPCIYYGDEIGMDQGQSRYPEASRYTFNWDETSWDRDLRADIRHYIQLRQTYPALRTGEFIPLLAQGQAIAYLRYQEGLSEPVVIAMNSHHEQVTNLSIELPETIASITSWQDLLGHAGVQAQDGRLQIDSLLPRQAMVLVPEGAVAFSRSSRLG